MKRAVSSVPWANPNNAAAQTTIEAAIQPQAARRMFMADQSARCVEAFQGRRVVLESYGQSKRRYCCHRRNPPQPSESSIKAIPIP